MLDTDAGCGDGAWARLERFRLAHQGRPSSRSSGSAWPCGARPPAPDAAGRPGGPGAGPAGGLAGVVRRRPPRARPRPTIPSSAPGCPTGAVRCGEEAWEAARIEAGVPVGGREVTGSTSPPRSGLVDRTVSFTKGCFTGQELVARLDARGSNVARRLCGAVVVSDGRPAAGRRRGADRATAAHEVGAADVGGLVGGLAAPRWPWPPCTGGWCRPRRSMVRWVTAGPRSAAEARPLPLEPTPADRPRQAVADALRCPAWPAAADRCAPEAPPRTGGERHDDRCTDGPGRRGRPGRDRGDGRRAHHHLDPGPGARCGASSRRGCGPPCPEGNDARGGGADQPREQRHVVGDPARRRPAGTRTGPTVTVAWWPGSSPRRPTTRCSPPTTSTCSSG